MTEAKNTEISPEEIYKELLADVASHGIATENFMNSFMFYGKTLKQHSDDLWVDIPSGKITPEIYREIFVKVSANIQIAFHYYNIASTISSALAGGGKKKKAELMESIARSYENKKARRPGQDLIDQMAESYMSSTTNVTLASRIIKDFWKSKIDSLIEVRKNMEQFGISLHSELKYLPEK